MTNLDWLYAAIEGRTKGPWRYAQLLDGIEARALLDGTGYHFCQIDDLQNGEFIATMGTCADEIAAVLRAAEDLKSLSPGYWSEHLTENENGLAVLSPLKSALAALAAKAPNDIFPA